MRRNESDFDWYWFLAVVPTDDDLQLGLQQNMMETIERVNMCCLKAYTQLKQFTSHRAAATLMESELEYMRNEPSQKIVRLVTDLAAIWSANG